MSVELLRVSVNVIQTHLWFATALMRHHNRLSNYQSHLSVLSIIDAASLLLFSHIKAGTHSHRECGMLHVCVFLCMHVLVSGRLLSGIY